jgi:cytoskeletal protein CcmA (bactofilin family)
VRCPTEFTYSTYLDRELSAEESRQVEAHLTACDGCRMLVEALRAETRILAEAMQSVPAPAASTASDWRVGLRMLLGFSSMIAVAAVFVTAATWLESLLPDAVEMNLFNKTAWMDLAFSGALYLANQGVDFMSSIIFPAIGAVLAVAAISGAYLLARRSLSMALLAGLVLVFAVPPSASAIEMRRGQSVTVPSGETVDGTLLAGGESVTIDGTVRGDLITWGRRVVVRGAIKGDVIDFSQNLDLEGSVDGNVYAVAQSVDIRGTVGRVLYAWARGVQIYSGGQVSSDLITGCAETNISGTVRRDAVLFCGSADVRGNIGRNLSARVGNIALTSPARVGGDFTAHVSKRSEVQIEQGATVSGKTAIELSKPRTSLYLRPGFYFWQAVRLVAALATGVVLFALWPFLLPARLESAGRTLISAGIGFLILVATPVALLILAVTLIGLPLAIIGLLSWLVFLYLAKIFVAAVIGLALVSVPPERARERLSAIVLPLLLGLAILFVGMNVPYVGGLVSSVVLLFGLGLAFRQLYAHWHTTVITTRRP